MGKFLFFFLVTFLSVCSCSQPLERNTKTAKDRQADSVVRYMPENNLHEHENYNQSGTTEQEFNDILDMVDQIYSPIIQRLGGNLVIERAYEDSTVNAYASLEGSNWVVSFFGGLAKRVNPEGFALVVCHELGHFLNGYVLYPDTTWASAEGASDGYSTQVCAKKIFARETSDNCGCRFYLPSSNDYSEYPQCERFGNTDDKLICERTLKGALSLAELLASLGREPVPTLNNLDRSVVKNTKYNHPSAKCRLTVYYEGAMSTKKWNDSVIPQTKSEMMKYNFQTQPNCWYSGK